MTMLYGFERRGRSNSLRRVRGRFRHMARTLALACALPFIGAANPGASPSPGPQTGTEPMVEGRALWVTRYEYNSPADVAEIIATAASANFNVIYFQVR